MLKVEIVSIEGCVFSGEADEVIAPASLGGVGILPSHTPFISTLSPGEIIIKNKNSEEIYIYVAGGILDVTPTSVTVLSDTVVRAEDLDQTKIQEAKLIHEEALSSANNEIDIAHAQAELAAINAQMKAISNLRNKISKTGSKV